MKKLPDDLQVEFFKFLNKEICVEDFEKWIYATRVLENHINEDDYLELISLNYNDRHLLYELKLIVSKYLNFGAYETRRIKRILNFLISKNENFAQSLIATYDLYCDGYGFLDNLGMGYGLTFANDFYDFNNWLNLSEEKKENRVDSIFEGVANEATKVLQWLDERKIIITDGTDDLEWYEYIDIRTVEEKETTSYSVLKIDTTNDNTKESGEKISWRSWLNRFLG